MSWERVRQSVRCAYGCEIPHPNWAYFKKYPFVVCESCAAKYGIVRPQVEPPADDAGGLVPASPDRPQFTATKALAEQFKSAPDQVFRRASRRGRRS